MKIVLMKDYKSLGHQGDVVDVKSGYASNFLIPGGIALVADQESITKARAGIKRKKLEFPEKDKSVIKVNLEKSFKKVDGKKFRMTVPVTSGGRLVELLDSTKVESYLLDTWKLSNKGVDLKIELGTQIKETGKYSVEISLSNGEESLSGRIIFEVVGE